MKKGLIRCPKREQIRRLLRQFATRGIVAGAPRPLHWSMMASPSRVGFIVAIVLIAACNSDTLVTPPRETEPDGSLQATKRVVVIDSTSLPFAGIAADRAAGHYVFAIQGSVRAIAAGRCPT